MIFFDKDNKYRLEITKFTKYTKITKIYKSHTDLTDLTDFLKKTIKILFESFSTKCFCPTIGMNLFVSTLPPSSCQ